MSTLSIPNTAVSGTTISSSDYNANNAAIEAWASGNIDDTNLLNDGITGSDKLKNLSVTKAKLAADSVDESKIEDDAVQAEHIQYDSIIVMPLDYVASGRLSGLIFVNLTADDYELKSVQIIASNAPSGGDEVFKVTRLPNTFTDPDVDSGTDLTFSSTLGILDGDNVGTERTVSAEGTLSTGEAWVVENLLTNGASDVSAIMRIGRA